MKLDFLNGPFYIDKNYGLGLVPGLLSLAIGGPVLADVPDKKVLLASVQHTISASNTSGGSVTTKKVVVLDFKQPVVKYSDWNYLGTQDYISILRSLKTSNEVGAVVLDVDSGGGQAFGTPEFYDAIKGFTSVKPLLIYSGGYLCSAAYYFAAPATKIIVNPRSEAIGSIGAYTVLVDFKGIYEKLGAKIHTIYSSKSEDKNKNYENVMNGKDADYSVYIKEELDPLVSQFHADIIRVRPHLAEEVLKGGTWGGEKAVELNLADATGTLEDTINEAFLLIDSSKNNTNQNPKNVSKLDLPNVENVLGLTVEAKTKLFSKTEECTLTADQMTQLNKALADKDAAIAQLNTEKQTLADSNTTLNAEKASFATALESALTRANVTAGADASASVALLADKVVELGAQPGTGHSNSPSEGDPSLDVDKPSYSIFESLIK